MKSLILSTVLAIVSVSAIADEIRTVPAQSDTRVVLAAGDRVTVGYSQVRKYRCAEGVLVVREWGSRYRLTCSVDGAIDARGRDGR